jgi:hypothetical protein
MLALVAFTGSAYALFSSTINFGGLSMTVGNSALQVQLPDGSWVNDDWTSDYVLSGLYPGLSTSANFQLKNTSSAPISLDVTAQLVSADGDWDTLKDIITVRVHKADDTRSSTGYKTLAAWNAEGGIDLPGAALAQGETRAYTLDIAIDKKYGNELANKKLSNIKVALTGTQED